MNGTGHSIYIARLIAKQALGRVTDAEAAEISQWVSASAANRRAYEDLLDAEKQRVQFAQLRSKDTDAAFGRVRERYRQHIRRKRVIRLLPYAAAAILVAIAGTWLYFADQIADLPAKIVKVQEIQPGGNRAMLTLADGRTIDLSADQSGIVVGDGIAYLDGSAVLSEQGSMGTSERVDGPVRNHKLTSSQVHKLTTPKGGTYQITLPDGTKVWLNAASTLKYPSRFSDGERVVELTGEAYFDVSEQVTKGASEQVGGSLTDSQAHKLTSSQKIPFKVITNGQTVEVLGTQFNISAYTDEVETKTTLVEGAVRLRNGATGEHISLAPGEQATLAIDGLTKQQVDVGQYTAWRSGYFAFNDTPIHVVMKQIGRWYDIEVRYEGGVPTDRFDGEISRELTLQQVLNGLAATRINYRVEGNTLTIINYPKPN